MNDVLAYPQRGLSCECAGFAVTRFARARTPGGGSPIRSAVVAAAAGGVLGTASDWALLFFSCLEGAVRVP